MIIILSIITMFLFCAGGLIYQLNAAKKQRARVLSLIGAKQEKKEKKDKDSLAQKDIAKKLETLAQEQSSKKNKKQPISSMIQQAGMSLSAKGFWIRSILFACVFTAIIKMVTGNPVLMVLGFIIGLLGLPKLYLKMKAGKRQKAFLKDFADALEAMIRLLKAGMPVTEAISMVGREFTGPVGDEMSQIYEAQKIGVPLPEAVEKAANRMPIPEMQMLATGITIQTQTGASLSDALQNLATLIRARHRLKRKVLALSSEATVSAGIIGALPIFVGTMLYFINPEYTGLLFTHGVGKVLSIGGAIWMSIGIFVMKQMINFKV